VRLTDSALVALAARTHTQVSLDLLLIRRVCGMLRPQLTTDFVPVIDAWAVRCGGWETVAWKASVDALSPDLPPYCCYSSPTGSFMRWTMTGRRATRSALQLTWQASRCV
jgi:hypothetical protein